MNFFSRKKGTSSGTLIGIVITIVFVTSLIPVMGTFISNAEGNLSATEYVLLSLTPLFIILGVLVAVGKKTGIMK